MSNAVIIVNNLGKQYRIGQSGHGARYQTLREAVMNRLNPTHWFEGKRPRGENNTIWALKDVSFEVQPGEVVGIIGRNGAGKSTLLKVLSRITDPTEGTVDIYGRVGSLLEVGTGFHPELTGRENIYLNGAILGMKRAEIDRKFDQIVDFSEVERFIDTPVKHYSSGMYLRLAFAVAAHLDPEILLVDEVLAVGDVEFQKKCMGKMSDVAGEGRTVLFVSHNMAAVSALCKKAVVIRSGGIDFPIGPADEAIQHYLRQVSQVVQVPLADRKDRQGEGKIRITGFAIFNERGEEQQLVNSGQKVELRIYYECVDNPYPKNVAAAIGITSDRGGFVTALGNQFAAEPFPTIPQRGNIACIIPKLPLSPGAYMLNLIIRQNDLIQDWIQEAIVLNVESGDFYMTGRLPPKQGGVFFDQQWLVQ